MAMIVVTNLDSLQQAALQAIVAARNAATMTEAQQKAQHTDAEFDPASVPQITVDDYLSEIFNAALDSYAEQFKAEETAKLRRFGEAIITASPEQAAQIQPLIKEAKRILGMQE
ncbi:MAG: hypothetical protein AUG51_07395 [Acidobacteria bacterium 13_1_20CM_3_53_8]|nr:MAG: hypothetical protein AUG51_07395 [Acidobacteria bacterium 13_1_20CM_3_53_8]